MTVTTTRTRTQTRLHWVPAAAGWFFGIIATAALLSSVSMTVRHLTRVPREFIDRYLFNFPDTSFAWAFVLALLAAALAARKRIAWLILILYMVASIGWNLGDLITGDETWMEESGEVIGLAFHVAAVAFLVLARKEFWAKVRRGALVKAAMNITPLAVWSSDIGDGVAASLPSEGVVPGAVAAAIGGVGLYRGEYRA